jgi:hypothetical protein
MVTCTQICGGTRYQADNDVVDSTRSVPFNHRGHRALLSYEGQPQTCYGCGATGHIYPGCPMRKGHVLIYFEVCLATLSISGYVKSMVVSSRHWK